MVVPQEDGWYLVNGRFRKSAPELIARANCMRTRQRTPAFQTPTSHLDLATGAPPKGHPVFWKESTAAEQGSNDFQQPADINTEGA